MSSQNKLVFAWWNTSLAPTGKSRSDTEQREIACQVIQYMITEIEADFIALGEMSELDFAYLQERFIDTGYSFHSEISKVGRSRFDICYICNELKFTVLGREDIVSRKGETTLKVAKRIDLGILQDGSVMHVFASHWPSRLWCEQHHANRHTLGLRLRDSFDDMFVDQAVPYVVMLGDYNDDPFDESLSQHLMGSRDPELVSRKKHLLYNPFWNQLGRPTADNHAAGSYFYSGGQVTKWHTFDQLMFSHAFLASQDWVYNHGTDLILEIPVLVQLVKNPKTIFDHLPVYGVVEKVMTNG